MLLGARPWDTVSEATRDTHRAGRTDMSDELRRANGPEADLCAHAGRLELLLTHLSGRALRKRVEVEDLVQEVFLRALASPQQLALASERGELAPWLASLARRVVIDVARAARAAKRAGREEQLRREEWSASGAGHALRGPGPATEAQTAEMSGRMARAFLALSPEHRRVIGLRQFEGLCAADAARRMGRSEAAVHSLYRRALEAWERSLG